MPFTWKKHKYYPLANSDLSELSSLIDHNQRGGQPTSQTKAKNPWFIQSSPPNSYKIQLAFLKIPKHLQLKRHFVDIPRKFSTMEEAVGMAQKEFPQYEFRIVPSNSESDSSPPSEHDFSE